FHSYWLLPLIGPMLVLAALAIACLGRLHRCAPTVAGLVVLVFATTVQPRRWRDVRLDHVYPAYAAVVSGARAVALSRTPVKRVDGPDDGRLPTSTTPVLRWLGGGILPEADMVAKIARDGSVRYAIER